MKKWGYNQKAPETLKIVIMEKLPDHQSHHHSKKLPDLKSIGRSLKSHHENKSKGLGLDFELFFKKS